MDETTTALNALVDQTPDLHDYAVTDGSGGGEPDYLWVGNIGAVELGEYYQNRDEVLGRLTTLVRLAQAVPWLLSLVEDPASPVSPPELPEPPQSAERTAPEQLWALVASYNSLCDQQLALNNCLRQGSITDGSSGFIKVFNDRESAFLAFCREFEAAYSTIYKAFLGMQKYTREPTHAPL